MKWLRNAVKYFGLSIVVAIAALLISLGCGVAVIYGKLNGWWT